MARRNDNPLEQIGGFFEALFGSCMGEERKAVKKTDDTRVTFQTKPDNLGSVFVNLVSAFNHDENELKRGMNDLSQMSEMARNKEGGMGSGISQATKYLSGQEPPGFFTDSANMLTGKTPKYALPLSQDQREKTVESLNRYYEENSYNDLYRLSQSAKDIANKLKERDNFGYRHQSLASAADEAGLTKEKIQGLFDLLNKSRALEQAEYLAGDLRLGSQNQQPSLGSSGLSPADNLHPPLNQRSPFSNSRLGAGAAGVRGIHPSRLLRNGARAGERGGHNFSRKT